MQKRVSTGISGLDEVIQGGLIPERAYLLRGTAGAGKTTLGLHFLAAGVAAKEETMYITMGEPATQIRTNAELLQINLKNTVFLDLSPNTEFFTEVQTYDIFSPAEVEREPTTQRIVKEVEALKPSRVFLDAMTQFRYLAPDPFQFRKQVLSFLRFLLEQGATVIFTSEATQANPDDDLQFISDGVIELTNSPNGRTIAIPKFRGSDFRSGHHSVRLTSRGMQVFPRLQPEAYQRDFVQEAISSGVPELDEMLHGGLERGTVTLISGPTGVGKTTLGIQFMKEAAGRGERSVVYSFEEGKETIVNRCQAVNIPIMAMMKLSTLEIVPVEPLQFTPDEFAREVRHEVEKKSAKIVMIDSVSGYRLCVRGETLDLITHLHALCKYLQNMGVTVILNNEMENITGDFKATDIGISYIADNIVFLRYLELFGEMRKTIGVLKKRLSSFEKNLREIEVTRYGIKVGKPLSGLRNILSGKPEWIGEEGK